MLNPSNKHYTSKHPDSSGAMQPTDAWGLGKVHNSLDGYYRLLGVKARTPGQYNLGATNEYMHPCVRYRWQRDALWSSSCEPLDGFECREMGDGTYMWIKEKGEGGVGRVTLPEWEIDEEEDVTETKLAGERVLEELYPV